MFLAFQASLADTAIHQLDTLLAAAYAAGALARPKSTIPSLQLPNRFAHMTIQADNANGGTVFVGDAGLTSSNYGNQLQKGTQIQYDMDLNSLSTLDIYLLASAATQKVNVILIGV